MEVQVIGLEGNGKLKEVVIYYKMEGDYIKEIDYFVLFFGLIFKMGLLQDWGFDIDFKDGIRVDIFDYSINIFGVFVIGDINIYLGKLKFILCGFYEVMLMCQFVFKIVYLE